MVVANANATVDISDLKARNPLGDAVEAAGIALAGARGRVRQGVCPFHKEGEGSFTVYSDSEKFYCFGCGSKGRRAGLRAADGKPDPARGHPAAGRRHARR